MNQRFEQVYDDYALPLKKYIYWSVPASEMEDLYQEVLIKLWKASARKQVLNKSYIFIVAKNQIIDFYRKRSRREATESFSEREHLMEDLSITEREKHIAIKKIIGDMPQDYKEVFILFYKLNFTVADIAQSLKLKEGSVKRKLFEARNWFKEQYAGELVS